MKFGKLVKYLPEILKRDSKNKTLYSLPGDDDKKYKALEKSDEIMIIDIKEDAKQCRKDDIPVSSHLYGPALYKMAIGELNWEKENFSMLLVSNGYKFDQNHKTLVPMHGFEVGERHKITNKKLTYDKDHHVITGEGKMERWDSPTFTLENPLKYMIFAMDTGKDATSIPLGCHEILIRGGTTYVDSLGLCDDGVWRIVVT